MQKKTEQITVKIFLNINKNPIFLKIKDNL